MRLEIAGKEYKIEYNFNTLVDTDLLDNVGKIQELMSGNTKNIMSMAKDIMKVTRDMLFVGLEENNPLSDKKEAGRLVEAYMKEGTEDEPRTILSLFNVLFEELNSLGFLFMNEEAPKKVPKTPQDHKKPSK